MEIRECEVMMSAEGDTDDAIKWKSHLILFVDGPCRPKKT